MLMLKILSTALTANSVANMIAAQKEKEAVSYFDPTVLPPALAPENIPVPPAPTWHIPTPKPW